MYQSIKIYLTVSALLALFVLLNMVRWQSTSIGIIFGGSYLLVQSLIIGTAIFPKDARLWRGLWGFLFLCAGIAVVGAAGYYVLDFRQSIMVLLVLLPAVVGLFIRRAPERLEPLERMMAEFRKDLTAERSSLFHALLGFIALVIDLRLLIALASWSTDHAIRSPWQVTSPKFFILFALSSLLLLIYLKRTKHTLPSFLLLFAHTLTMTGVAAIIYQIGFGFDGFIHRAAMTEIIATGKILPKTPYYIGAYALEIWLAKILQISLGAIDRWLLPVASALYLQLGVFFTLRKTWGKEKAVTLLVTALSLVIPVSLWIATTPQGLAYLFAVMTALLAFGAMRQVITPVAPLITAAAALAIHPLTGIPTFLFAVAISAAGYASHTGSAANARKRLRHVASLICIWLAALLSALAIPLLFSFKYGALDPKALVPLLQTLTTRLVPIPYAEYPHIFILFASAFAAIIVPALVAIAIIGLFLFVRTHKKNGTWIFVTFSLATTAAAFLLLAFPQGLVATYEQTNFANRLAICGLIFLAPFILYALAAVVIASRTGPKTLIVFLTGAAAALTAASLYISYPRADLLVASKGWSVSASDVRAVHAIEDDANGASYIVLANQAVSAAALQEFGFQKLSSVSTDCAPSLRPPATTALSYPIPTGGLLYAFYLRMVYESPNRETALAANAYRCNRKTGSPIALTYFVLNRYWDRADKIARAAQTQSDAIITIDNGAVTIFRYSR